MREEDFYFLFFYFLTDTELTGQALDVSVLRLAARCLLIDRVREDDGVCGVVGYLAGFLDTVCVHCRVSCS